MKQFFNSAYQLAQESPYVNKKLFTIYGFVVIAALISYNFYDIKIVHYFYANLSKFYEDVFEWITIAGEGVYYVVPALALYFIYKKKNDYVANASLLIFWSVLASGIVVNLIKVIVARYRPLMIKEDLYGFSWFDFGYAVNSFPSGHSSTALGVYTAFALLFPKFRYPLILMGMIIAFSRAVITVHFFSDVLIGSMIGSFIAILLYQKFMVERKPYEN